MTPDDATLIEWLRDLVEVETPSGDTPGLDEGFIVLSAQVERAFGRQPTVGHVSGTPYLYLPALARPSVLVVGHLDTVWPRGTLAEIPFTVTDGVARGPGVLDMKAGLVIASAAVAQCAVSEHVGLLVTGDEEIGSPIGRSLVEQHCADYRAVFVPEAAASGGAVKVGRKGVSIYRLSLLGREAHAGLEPERGLNTTVEMGALIGDLVALQDDELGTTVTPTKATSGVTGNTIPAEAVLHVDVRAWTMAELERVDTAIRSRVLRISGIEMLIHGGINRPPMDPEKSVELVEIAKQAAVRAGMDALQTARVGGGSDASFSAALGIPTLDGVGACGEGAHARHEWVDISSLSLRARWLARTWELLIGAERGAGTGLRP